MSTDTRPPEKKLGRGLSALLGENKFERILKPNDTSGNMVEMIPIANLVAGVYQPRRSFDETELSELAYSIREKGIIQPLVVRKDGDHYEIIAGERRYRAAKIAGLEVVPALVRSITNQEALELALIENIQRADLSAVEEALGYRQLLADFGYSEEQISVKIGKSRSYVTNSLRLLNLPAEVLTMIDQKLISAGHARAIINALDPLMTAKLIAEKSLSVREVEDLVRQEKKEQANLDGETDSAKQFSDPKSVEVKKEISIIEKELSALLGLRTEVSYSGSKDKGKVIVRFEGIAEVFDMIERLSHNLK